MRCILVTIIVTYIFNGALPAQSNNAPSIVGTWHLVSSKYTSGTTVTNRDSSTIAEYKVITPNFFMYSAFNKKNDSLIGTTAGHLTYNGKEMTHTATYSSSKNRVGITATYAVEVKGNMLYQKGKLSNYDLEEVWVRHR